MKQSITIKVNAWIICAILLLANIITIAIWQPWSNRTVSDRTISVTGSTTIKAEPDEFVFSPYYQRQGDDSAAINNELGELATTITNKLKELGVPDSAIKYDVNSYDYSIYYGGQDESTSTLYFTITVNDKILSQQILDYIVTTDPDGSITPQISFSTDKQKTLENQAREEALNDAKSKAEASATQLDSSIGRLVSITDSYNWGDVYPMYETGSEDSVTTAKDSATSYTIQPGLNEYNFSVNVTYEIR